LKERFFAADGLFVFIALAGVLFFSELLSLLFNALKPEQG